MIEDIFLAYANNLLKNNPQNFYAILDQVEKNENIISIDKSEFKKIIEYIIELSKFTNSQDFLSNVEKRGGINHYDDRFDNDLYHAVLAIAGEREDYYTKVNIWKEHSSRKDFKYLVEYSKQSSFQCDLRKTVKAYTGQDFCEEQFVQKCYECHQLSFRYCLLQIVSGKEYLDIDIFHKDVMNWSEEISASKTHLLIEECYPKSEEDREKPLHQLIEEINSKNIKSEGKPFRQSLGSVKTIFPIFYEFSNSPLGNSYHVLNNLIFAIASYSLTEFLVANDRRKLKYCPYCERFFIAKDIKRKHSCYSNDCIRKWERDKKKDQRDKEPVKYI
jgi:hypothetical protein